MHQNCAKETGFAPSYLLSRQSSAAHRLLERRNPRPPMRLDQLAFVWQTASYDMKRVKLLLYSHFFAPSVGGVEVTVLALARGLAQSNGPEGQPEFEIILVTQVEARGFDDRELPFRVVRRPWLWELALLVKNCDIVHLAGPALLPFVLALLAGKPVVVVHHGFQAICPNGQLYLTQEDRPCPGHFMAGRHGECLRCNRDMGMFASGKLWLLTFVRRFLCAHASMNVTETDWLRQLLRLQPTRTIPLGLAPPQTEKRRDVPSMPPVIAFVGRLVTTKGFNVLLVAVKLLLEEGREFQLRVIGDGPERAALERAATARPLVGAIHFLGRIPTAEMAEELSRARAVVVPSLAGEVFGRAVAENMQRGLAVIASDLGSFREVLGNAGLLFRTGDAKDLARQIGRALDEPGLAANLGEQALVRIESEFSYSKMMREHVALYESLAEEK